MGNIFGDDYDPWGLNGSKKSKKSKNNNSSGGIMGPGYDPWGTKEKVTKRDSRRAFSLTQKNEIWDRQDGLCARCGSKLMRSATHYDHKIPWEDGGKTEVSNGQALCANCHSIKTNKDKLKKVDKKRNQKSDSGSSPINWV